MKLLHLAAGRKHVLWAVCDEGGECQVLETLLMASEEGGERAALAEDIMALAFEEVPNNGIPDDPRRVKNLYREILYELKADRGNGKQHEGLRIAFFFEGPKVLICTNAFYKGNSTPPRAHEKALSERQRYLEAKERGQLEFESVED